MPDYGTQILKKLLDDVKQMSLEDYEKLYFAAQEREDISVILDLNTNSTTFNYQKQSKQFSEIFYQNFVSASKESFVNFSHCENQNLPNPLAA